MNRSKSKTSTSSKTGGSKGFVLSKPGKKGGMLNPQLPIIVGASKIMDLHANIPKNNNGASRDAFNSMPSEGSEIGYLQVHDVAGGSLRAKTHMGKKPSSVGGTSSKKAPTTGSNGTNKALVGGGTKKTTPKGGSGKSGNTKKKSP